MTFTRRTMAAALLLCAPLATATGLQELDSQQLQEQTVANTLSPQAADAATLDSIEDIEQQQRLLPDAEYVARPQPTLLPQDTGASEAQKQFMQSLINTFGNVAGSAR